MVSANTQQRIAKVFIWGGGAITVTILIGIILYVLIQGIPAIDIDFLTTRPEGGLSGEGGISTAIVGTLYLLGITLAILVVPGIGAGIYLAEYARDNRMTRAVRYAVEVLAGVPSIVFGLFGFALFVTALHFNFSIISGALTLVCLLLPTLIRTTEESIRAVPRGYREASLAMGASKWQTIVKVVLPAALPGIMTGVILCAGRIVEETACLYVTMGGSSGMPTSLRDPGRTLSLHLYYLVSDTMAFDKAMATGAVLILIIVVINAVTNGLSRRFVAKMRGG